MMKLKHYLLFVISFISLLSISLQAQSFSASVNSTTIGLNEPFQVSFQFNGDDINNIRNFRAPDFRGFRVLSGPNQATSMQIINGAVSASLTYSYYVQASDLGNQTIGSASLDYKGKTYKTQPIKLNVIKGQAAPQNNQKSESQASASPNIADNLFIRAVADRQKVYKGEQVTVTYKLYTRLDISSPQISKLPSYQGFWSEELETSNRINFSTEVVNGKQYHVGILKRAALFPTQTGQLSVTPFELKIPVIVPKQRRRGDIFDEFFNDPFFNQGQTVEYNAKSNTIKIDVLQLPSVNVPSGFTGGVGDFQFKATVDKNTVKQNEPVTLKLSVTGTGNINLLEMPEIKLPAGFEKYEPKTNVQVNKTGIVSGQKTVEYLVVPRIQGNKEIPPVEFSYYNPRLNRYITQSSPAFTLNIEKGDNDQGNVASGFNKEDVKLLGEDIRFIKTSTGELSHEGAYIINSFWFWAASILPLFALTGTIAWKRRNDKLAGNLQLMRYQRAEKIARNRLKAAQKSMTSNNQKEFYTDISLALFGYLEDKLHIPKADFTIEHALEVLKKNNVPESIIENVRRSVEQCEYARFAPMSNGAVAMKEMYNQAAGIIVELEKSRVRA